MRLVREVLALYRTGRPASPLAVLRYRSPRLSPAELALYSRDTTTE